MRWLEDNRAGYDYWTHDRVLLVRYESLVKNPHKILSKVFDFLGETMETQILQFHQKERCWYRNEDGHGVYRDRQINQSLFDGSGQWLDLLTEEEKYTFQTLAGNALIINGYSRDTDCYFINCYAETFLKILSSSPKALFVGYGSSLCFGSGVGDLSFPHPAFA